MISEKVRSIDWTGIVKGVIEDIRGGKNATVISTRFHLTLIKIIVDMAHQANKSDIVLTGGCFQNKWLLEGAVNRQNTSRVNQVGPELFGFRGNALHLDLNRDFI